MIEPIQGGGEVNEPEECGCELFIARAKSAVTFHPAKEVFDLVTLTVVTAVKSARVTPRTSGWNTGAGFLAAQPRTKGRSIKGLVCNNAVTAQVRQQGLDGPQIVTLSRSQGNRDGSSASLDHDRHFRIESTLGATNRLRLLAAGRVGAMLVELDVRAIQGTQFTFGRPGHRCQEPSERTRRTPPPKARIDRVPRSESFRQIAPRQPRAQNVNHRRDHKPVIFAWPTPTVPICPMAFFDPLTLIFLAVPISGPANRNDCLDSSNPIRSLHLHNVPKFENTP